MKQLIEAKLYRDAGAVQRYHTKRTHRVQSIADHTFGVLMLITQVGTDELLSGELYQAALHHDLPELYTGDMPGTIKRAVPELGALMDRLETDLAPLYVEFDLNGDQAALLKWADRMELVLWCMEEYRMGNTYVRSIIARGLGWINASYYPLCASELTAEVIVDAWTLGIAPATGAELEMKL